MSRRRPPAEGPPPVPSADLCAALIGATGLDGVDVLGAWAWRPLERRWGLLCRLTIARRAGGDVPGRSDWIVTVAPDYPQGEVAIYPAAVGGIEQTFAHQNLNRPLTRATADRRTGKLCVDSAVRGLGRQGLSPEPHDAASRLAWHLWRACRWLEAAADGTLRQPGDPFELPDFGVAPHPLVAFAEGAGSADAWGRLADRSGLVSLVALREHPAVIVADMFRGADGRELYQPRWGTYIRTRRDQATAAGLWVRFDGPPTLPPWRAPITWGELRACAAGLGTDLDATLQAWLPALRDGAAHLALVGFPVPATVGGAASEMYWQPLRIPALTEEPTPTKTRTRRPRGATAPLRWAIERASQFGDLRPIEWLDAENWHPNTIAARGRLPAAMTEAEVFIIGAGALGAAVAELLVRGGVQRLIVCDHDIVKAGNLVRHTLGIPDVQRFKAAALADRLGAVMPFADVEAAVSAFPPTDARGAAALKRADVIIDCTGDDGALGALALRTWSGPRVFASVSLGLYAARLFCFTVYANAFPIDAFDTATRPWLEDQVARYGADEWPREGVGCWHPVFPARVDHVWMLAAAAVPRIVAAALNPPDAPELLVLERDESDDGTAAVRPAVLPQQSAQ